MITYDAVSATSERYDLAEGVIWDDRHNIVRWVDIRAGRVLAGTLVENDNDIIVTSHLELRQTASAVAVAVDGGLLIAGARGLACVSPTGIVSFGPDLLGTRESVRLNDGTVDNYGSFIVGTLSLTGDTGDEILMRVSPDGSTEVLRHGVRLSNGIAFSPNGRTIYHVDTYARTISSHSYGAGSFDRSEPWVPLQIETGDFPDGLTVDSEGALWVAQWGGSCVRRHAPTGELLATVNVDAERVSCPGFVGRSLDRLAITSAHEGIGSGTGHDGALFLAAVGVTGISAHRWAGSTTHPDWKLSEGQGQ